MSEQIDILTYWKEELSSDDSERITAALVEIIEIIKKVKKAGICETAFEILINSDLCHFLCEILSIESLYKTPFINVIICHLSESSNFFKNDFFRVMKYYLRLMTSMTDSSKADLQNYRYIDEIFRFMTLILMR